MPVGTDLTVTLELTRPADAHTAERLRDRVLAAFGNRYTRVIFGTLAVLCCLCLIGFALLFVYCFLGIFCNIDNGWSSLYPACADALAEGESWSTTSVPRVNGSYVAEYCTDNQRRFNWCVKAFVVIFSYINFLPIPWRVAILHHATCTTRRNDEGFDFYGRPTGALWFCIPRTDQRRIAIALNLAWILHFICLAMHLAYWPYIEGQVLPGAVLQNVPFISSILCQISAVYWQGQAEGKLMRQFPDRYPPKLSDEIFRGVGKWKRGEERGTLPQVIRSHMRSVNEAEAKIRAANPQGVLKPDMLTGIVHGFGLSRKSLELSPSVTVPSVPGSLRPSREIVMPMEQPSHPALEVPHDCRGVSCPAPRACTACSPIRNMPTATQGPIEVGRLASYRTSEVGHVRV